MFRPMGLVLKALSPICTSCFLILLQGGTIHIHIKVSYLVIDAFDVWSTEDCCNLRRVSRTSLPIRSSNCVQLSTHSSKARWPVVRMYCLFNWKHLNLKDELWVGHDLRKRETGMDCIRSRYKGKKEKHYANQTQHTYSQTHSPGRKTAWSIRIIWWAMDLGDLSQTHTDNSFICE